MRLIDVSVLKEWIENWFTKNRFYHPYAKNNNIPITELYDILEQMPTAQQWIPCSERLPKNHENVLVCGVEALNNVHIYGVKCWDVDEWRPVSAPSCTWEAWMPLPEPYAERREE